MCTPAGREDRLDARKAGDIATVAAISATTLGAAGLISYLVGRNKRRDERPSARLSGGGWIASHGAGAAISGGF